MSEAVVYRVVKSAAKVSIGSASGNSVARILREGDIVPAGVSAEDLERLTARGIIAPLEEFDAIESTDPDGDPVEVTGEPAEGETGDPATVVPAGTDGVEIPEGDPGKAWTHPQLDAWAAAQNPPIVFDANASKDVKLAAIEQASKQS